MARLQDFASITPTSSDSVLGVQSAGQGLIGIDTALSSSTSKIPTSAAVKNAMNAGLAMLSGLDSADTSQLRDKLIRIPMLYGTDVGLSGSSTPTQVVTAWLNYAVSKYPKAGRCLLEGMVSAGTYRKMSFYIYDAESSPITAAGTMTDYDGTVYYASTYNGNYNVYKLQDYVIEEGTSGSWTYRKWKSGIYECWRRISYTVSVNSAWGTMYAGALPAQNYPVTFSASPFEQATFVGGDGWGWLAASGSPTTTQTGTYYVIRPTSATNLTLYVDFYVRGTI